MTGTEAKAPLSASRERLLITLSLTITALIVFVIGEFALRVLSTSTDYIPKAKIGDTEQHAYLGKTLTPGYSFSNHRASFSVNSRGFRGPEFDASKAEGTYRIFALGGSTTFGFFPSISADDKTYPAQLQTILNKNKPDANVSKYEVINAGVPGYSTRTSLHNLASRILYYQPDMIIIYHNTNDLSRYGDEQELIKPLDKMANRTTRIEAIFAALFDWSYLLMELKFTTVNRIMPMFASHSMAGTSTEWQEDERYAEAFARDLTSLIAVAKAHGIKVVMPSQSIAVTAATNYKKLTNDEIGMQLDKPDPYHPGIPPQHRFQMFSKYNAIIEQVANKEGVTFVDANRVIPKTPEYHSDYCHLTDKGASLLAQTVASGVAQSIQR